MMEKRSEPAALARSRKTPASAPKTCDPRGSENGIGFVPHACPGEAIRPARHVWACRVPRLCPTASCGTLTVIALNPLYATKNVGSHEHDQMRNFGCWIWALFNRTGLGHSISPLGKKIGRQTRRPTRPRDSQSFLPRRVVPAQNVDGGIVSRRHVFTCAPTVRLRSESCPLARRSWAVARSVTIECSLYRKRAAPPTDAANCAI